MTAKSERARRAARRQARSVQSEAPGTKGQGHVAIVEVKENTRASMPSAAAPPMLGQNLPRLRLAEAWGVDRPEKTASSSNGIQF